MGRKLYVGNLPYQATEEELTRLFAQAGPVASVQVMKDAMTGRARGFAFVEMDTEDGAQKAVADFHQYQLGGRALVVNEARPRTPGGGRFGEEGGGSRREPRW